MLPTRLKIARRLPQPPRRKTQQPLANSEYPGRAVPDLSRTATPCLSFCPITLSLTSINFGLWEDYYNKTQNENDIPEDFQNLPQKRVRTFSGEFGSSGH
jgi:hypothetical protein